MRKPCSEEADVEVKLKATVTNSDSGTVDAETLVLDVVGDWKRVEKYWLKYDLNGKNNKEVEFIFLREGGSTADVILMGTQDASIYGWLTQRGNLYVRDDETDSTKDHKWVFHTGGIHVC